MLIWAGDGEDTLVMEAGAELDGFFDGQTGLDTLDYRQYGYALEFTLLPELGLTDGFNIRTASIYEDALNMEQIFGTDFVDTLYGRDAQAVFNLYDGLDNYLDETSSRVLYFDFIEDLYGGSDVDAFNLYGDHSGNLHGMAGDDSFTFSNSAMLTGYLDGGLGFNSLDYTNYDTARYFDLTGFGLESGYTGTEASILVEFRNIDSITGHNGAGNDSLQGLDLDGVWTVTGSSAGLYLPQGASEPLVMASLETLVGESGADTFRFTAGSSLGGDIVAGGGTNKLDYKCLYISPERLFDGL